MPAACLAGSFSCDGAMQPTIPVCMVVKWAMVGSCSWTLSACRLSDTHYPPQKALGLSVNPVTPGLPLPQAAFTPKELREVLGLEGVAVRMDAATFELSPADEAELKATRMKKRVFDILSKQLKESKEG